MAGLRLMRRVTRWTLIAVAALTILLPATEFVTRDLSPLALAGLAAGLAFVGVVQWPLVLSGMATNLCVLFTAHDAHMHQYGLTVLSDCCAAESDFDHNVALKQLERFCGARVCLSTEFEFGGGG